MNTKTALQRCFNYFLDKAHKPGYRDGNCVYYANGSKPVMCAIGCLIPERLREKAGKVQGGVKTLLHMVPELQEVFAGVSENVLQEMQGFHDSWADLSLPSPTKREDFLNDLQSLICYHETKN